MNKFIKIFFFFTVIVTILSLATDYIISKGLRKCNLRQFQVWNDIYASNINGDWIISGNSRAWCSYSPKILDSVLHCNSYNIGIVGCPVNYQLFRYNTLIRFNPKPKYLIQNVDLYTFDYMKDAYEREQFFPYILDDSLINIISEDKKINYFERHFPLVRYYGYRTLIQNGISSFFGKKDFVDGGMYKGYRGNNWAADFSSFKKIDSIDYAQNHQAIYIFNQFLQKCKNDNVEVILVSAPMYFKVKSKIRKYNNLIQLFKNMSNINHLKFFDYTNDSICLDSTCFYNALHLNKKGAEKFTLKLAVDLKRTGY